MASDYKIRFKSYLPGAGKDASGNPAQGKTRVVGQIAVTSYTKGGEPLAPMDVGLVTIDAIHLRCANEVSNDAGAGRRVAAYNQSDDLFYLVTVGNTGATNEYESAATETVEFVAEGDSAHNVELL